MNHPGRLLIVGGVLLSAIAVGALTHRSTAPAPAAPPANAAVATTQPPLDQLGSRIGTAAPQDSRAAAYSQRRPSAMPRSPQGAAARVRNKRPVAIVGGSADAGAAVGAAAGGGKGAGIGAISGGAAGLVSDRLTNDR